MRAGIVSILSFAVLSILAEYSPLVTGEEHTGPGYSYEKPVDGEPANIEISVSDKTGYFKERLPFNAEIETFDMATGKLAIGNSDSGSIMIFKLPSFIKITSIGIEGGIGKMIFLPSGKLAVVKYREAEWEGFKDVSLVILDIEKGLLLKEINLLDTGCNPGDPILLDMKRNLIISGKWSYDLSKGNLRGGTGFSPLLIDPDGKWCLGFSPDETGEAKYIKKLEMFSLPDMKTTGELPLPEGTYHIRDITYAPGKHMVALALRVNEPSKPSMLKGFLCLYDTENGVILYSTFGAEQDFRAVSFTPDSRFLTVLNRNKISFLDIENGKEAGSIPLEGNTEANLFLERIAFIENRLVVWAPLGNVINVLQISEWYKAIESRIGRFVLINPPPHLPRLHYF